MIISAPYRMKRIFAFLDPFQDPLGSGFQMIQSLYAIGPGGILGSGFDQLGPDSWPEKGMIMTQQHPLRTEISYLSHKQTLFLLFI